MPLNKRVRIPKSRIGVLIGPHGDIKKSIEKQTNCKLLIDSDEGFVDVIATEELEDPTMILAVRDIVVAIGSGFSPKKALYLIDDDTYLKTIKLEGSQNNIKRLKSRIIGENGKTRKIIEKATNTYVSVFGDKVSIIGEPDEIEKASEAIEMLIKGYSHGSVYRYLERLLMLSKHDPLRIWKDKMY